MLLRLLIASLVLLACEPVAFADPVDDLRSPDAKVRAKAAKMLAHPQAKLDPARIPFLVERLREDTDPQVRFALADALGKVTPPQKLVLAALVEIATDRNEHSGIRNVAIGSLARCGTGSKRVVDAIASVATDDPDIVHTSIHALVKLGAEDRTKPILEHKDEKIRVIATQAYLTSGGANVLAVSFASPDPKVRLEAVERLANRDFTREPLKPNEIALLKPFVSDPDSALRVATMSVFTKAKQASQILDQLIEALASTDKKVREEAALGLATGGVGIAKHLPTILQEIDKLGAESLRASLIRSLGEAEVAAKPAIPKLLELLQNTDINTRIAALEALRKAGVVDPALVVRSVRPLLNDKSNEVRGVANQVMLAWAKLDTEELTRMLRDRELSQAMKALPLISRVGPDAAPLVPELFALYARIPRPRPGQVGGGEAHDIAVAISAMGPTVVPELVKRFQSNDLQAQKLAIVSLLVLRLDAVDALPILREGVLHSQRGIRVDSAMALANLGYRARAAIPDLIQSMLKYADTADTVAEAIGWIGASPEDAKKLIDLAKEAQPGPGRAARYRALGGAGVEAIAVCESLDKMLNVNDPDRSPLGSGKWLANREWVADIQIKGMSRKENISKAPHETAQTALKYELTADQKKKLTAGLIIILEERPESIQIEALRCLGWIGPEAADALPAIEKLTTAQSPVLQQYAKQAAKRIRK